jgi:hypothetical protein
LAKNNRKTRYTAATAASQGSAIISVNLANETLATWKASRLVRFDTGSSNDAPFARCAVAYA